MTVEEKLQKIRDADDLDLPDCSYLDDDLELRHYQKQMVLHLLLMKRFVVGDATGVGKCVTPDTWIRTDRGLMEIGGLDPGSEPDSFSEVKEDISVEIDGEEYPVEKFYNGGVKPTRQIQTKCGFEVEGTLNHPIRVWDGKSIEWKQTSQIEEGDVICISRGGSFSDENNSMISDIDTKKARNYSLPKRMNPDLARLFGYIIGEGTLGVKYSLTISQSPEQNPEPHQDILDLVDRCFGYNIPSPDQKDKSIHSLQIRRYLAENGLKYVTSRDRKIPDCVLQSKKECVVECLRALFEGEACPVQSGIEFSTASETLSHQVQQLLLMFGIIASRRERKVEYKGEERTYYRISILGKDAHLFREKIGFISDRKSSKLDKNLSDNSNTNKDLLPDCGEFIEDLRSDLSEEVTVEGTNEERKGPGIKHFGRSFESTLDNIRNRSIPFLKKLKENLNSKGIQSKSKDVLDDLLDREIFFDRVERIEEDENQVVDLQIQDRHAFIGNGFINHNTIEVLGSLGHLWERKGLHLKPVVITNTSALRQWESEIDTWMDGVDSKVVDEGPDKREAIYESFFQEWDQPHILITNYAKIRRDKRPFLQAAGDEDFAFILDEATACKNPSSKTHNKCKEIARHAERCYGMTATLIKNNLEEGYGIYKVVQPDLFASKRHFMRQYCVTRMQRIQGGRKIPIIVGHSNKHVKKFKEEIDPFFLGRAKHDVADELPSLVTKKVHAQLEGSQWHYYLQALEGFLEVNTSDQSEGEEELKETTKLTKLIYTQEIANSPYLIGNTGKSKKEDYFLDMMENDLKDEKVIVFTRFKEMINRFEEIFTNRGYEKGIEQNKDGDWMPCADQEDQDYFVRITGDEDDEERRAGQEAFQEGEADVIFITKAGIEAINLQSARVMLFYDLPWSAGDYLQTVGRMIRIGSPHESVYAIHLISEGPDGEETIDGHVQETLDKKMNLIENVIGERIKKEDPDDDEMAIETENEINRIFNKMQDSAKDMKGTDHDG